MTSRSGRRPMTAARMAPAASTTARTWAAVGSQDPRSRETERRPAIRRGTDTGQPRYLVGGALERAAIRSRLGGVWD